MIRIDDVGVDLGGSTVLESVSLSVDAGRFVALVGPNGAGKTTLLRTINGLIEPSRGTVALDGRDVAGLSAREIGRLVATVPQETVFDFEFSAEDVVAMGRTPHRGRFQTATPEDREAVRAAMERTETAQFAERPVTALSGGERQRVLLARALAQETPALLLDEPTASLDVNHQLRTLSLAREFVDGGTTVVAAIHDLELAARFCDGMVLLSGGRVCAAGSPDDVLTDETVEDAFDVRAAVGTNPVTGTRTVTPLSGLSPTPVPEGVRVHVVGRGERTARTVERLVAAGVEVTVGVVPEDDAALGTATSLASAVVTAPPFEAVDRATRRRAASLRDAASVTVATSRLSEPNRSLAAGAGTLLALEDADPPPGAETVAGGDLLEVIGARVDPDAPLSTPPE